MKTSSAQKQFFFLAGLPRSGSTLLGAILSQNPEIFVTPTSPLLDLLCFVEHSWGQIRQAKTWQDPHLLPNVYSGIIQNIYQHVDKPIVIDKHRGWPRNIRGVSQICGFKPKIICTTRDIPEILASYLLLAKSAKEKGRASFIEQGLRELGLEATDENQCRYLWERYVSDPYISLKTGFDTDPSCLHLVDYRDLVEKPRETVQKIYNFIGLSPFEHSFDRVANVVEERDELWGIEDLHVIRREVKRTSPPASDVLGANMFSYYRNARLEFWRR